MAQFIHVSNANSTTWISLVDCKEVGGTLNSVAVAGGQGHHYFQIILDDQTVLDTGLACGSVGETYENNGIPLNLTFKKSMRVNIKDEVEPSALARYWVVYTTTTTKPFGPPLVKERATDDTKFIFEIQKYRDEKGNEFSVDFLKGPLLNSKIILDKDVFYFEEDISGVLELKNYHGKPQYMESVEIHLRPLGFTKTIGEPTTIRNVDGKMEFTIKNPLKNRKPLSLDILPLVFHYGARMEVLTKMKGWANYPARFLFW